ncbi:hypothetical protein QWY20_17415 [Alkalimonas sp. MEB108]|uniref:Uncharacterized protein n=1 Tax=Alkalimonas cellulosilytica TaxID=3058395 RepID=A0ABU7J9M1_9GAMM|nr:hypothetical protein [Alkalimonas sp. MEB108]MEE2003236.1 hypothetical protein [Alkalimonas sp. MEB108]
MFFKKKKPTAELANEEFIFERVANEMKAGVRREGLWVKAIANSKDEYGAKSLYIQYVADVMRQDLAGQLAEMERADALKRKQEEEAQYQREQEEKERIKKLKKHLKHTGAKYVSK